MKKWILLFSTSICMLVAQDSFANVGGYATDPAVLKQLEELATQVKNLQGIVQNQNEIIQGQASEIKALQSSTGPEKTAVHIPAPSEGKAAGPA